MLLQVFAMSAQTLPLAEEVFNNYFKAIGGKEFLLSISDATMEMYSDMQGNTMMLSKKMKSSGKFVSVMTAGGMQMFKSVSDGKRIQMNGMQGENIIEGEEAQQSLIQGFLIPELHYAELKIKSTVAGVEKIEEADAYKVENETTDGKVKWTDFFDVTTGLKVRSISTMNSPQGEMKQVTSLKDYKDFKGLKYPTILSQDGGMFKMEFSVDKIKINTGLKEEMFVIK